MKLIYITNSIIPANDAQSKQVVAMCKAFNEHLKQDFALISPAYIGAEKLDVPFQWKRLRLPIEPRSLRYLGLLLHTIWTCLTKRPQGVFTRDLFVSVAATLCGTTSVYEIHKETRHRITDLALRVLVKFRRFHVLAISHALEDYVNKIYRVPKERLFTAHDGVDWTTFKKLAAQSREEVRKKLHLPLEQTIVVHSGSIQKGRGFSDLVTLVKAYPLVHFYQIGGQEKDVRAWQEQLRGHTNIHFVPPQPQSEVFLWQKAANLCLFLITRELGIWWCCSPLKVFEYMASGTPILAALLGSVKEVLNEELCYGYDPDKPEDIVRAMKKYLDDTAAAQTKSRAALSLIQTKYNWHNRTEEILEFLHINPEANP